MLYLFCVLFSSVGLSLRYWTTVCVDNVALNLFYSCSLFWLKHVKNLYTTGLYIFKRIVKVLRVVLSLDDGCPEVLFLKDWS